MLLQGSDGEATHAGGSGAGLAPAAAVAPGGAAPVFVATAVPGAPASSSDYMTWPLIPINTAEQGPTLCFVPPSQVRLPTRACMPAYVRMCVW